MSLASDFQTSPLWQKIVLIILAIFLVVGLLKNYVIQDKPQQIRQLQRKINKMDRDIKSQEIVAAEFDLVQRKYEEMQSGITEELPSLKTVLANLGYLISQGSASKINFTLVQPNLIIEEANFRKLPVTLKVRGELQPLAQFLKQIETSSLKSNVAKLEIGRITDGTYEASIELFILTSKSDSAEADDLQIMPKPTPVTVPRVQAKPKPVVVSPKWVVSGFWNGAQKGVFINNKLLKLGELVNGYRITDINSQEGRVTLIHNGKIKILTREK